MTEPAAPTAERPALLFDLDGTLVDSVYQHVLAWQEALDGAGIELSVWRLHRKGGMSGGPMAKPLPREAGRGGTPKGAARLRKLPPGAAARRADQGRAP